MFGNSKHCCWHYVSGFFAAFTVAYAGVFFFGGSFMIGECDMTFGHSLAMLVLSGLLSYGSYWLASHQD